MDLDEDDPNHPYTDSIYPDLDYTPERAPKRRRISFDEDDDSEYQPSSQSDSGLDEPDSPADNEESYLATLADPITGLPPPRRRRRRRGKNRRPDATADNDDYRRRPRGPRKPVEPSEEFKALHSEATSAFIDSDYDRAVALVKQAISVNPEIFAAHSLLAEVFLALGQKERALAALFTGAHTRPKDPVVWMNVARLVLDLAGGEGGEEGERQGQPLAPARAAALKDAIYCYSRVVDIDQKNYETRFRRAAAYRELGHNGRAATEYERLLKDLPNNMSALRCLTGIYIEMGEAEKARSRYEEAISHFLGLDEDGGAETQRPEDEEFDWSDVNIYVELFGYLKEYEQGVAALKFLARWMLGRAEDGIWDEFADDDREFDVDDHPRRTEVEFFEPGKYPRESYGEGLPMELRIKLGLYRLKAGGLANTDEAIYHFSHLPPTSPVHLQTYPDLFREVGDAFLEVQLYHEALQYLSPLQSEQGYADTNLFMSLAKCFAATENPDAAENAYLTVVEFDEGNVPARVALARFYDALVGAGPGREKQVPDETAAQKERRRTLAERALKFASEVVELEREEFVPRRRGARGEARVAQLVNALRAADAEAENQAVSLRNAMREAEGEGEEEPEEQRVQAPMVSLVASNVAGVTGQAQGSAAQKAPGTRREQIQYLYSKFHDFRGRMRTGKEDTAVVTEDWLDVADAMIRDFRANRVFFPVQKRSLFQGYARGKRRGRGRKEKGKGKKRAHEDEEREGEEEDDDEERDEKLLEEMEEIVARLQKFLGIAVDTDASSIPKDYHGIPFEGWLDVFLEYALVLSGQEHAQRQADEIYDTLATAADASVWYHDRKATRQIHVCWFTCALRMKDEETLSTIARWFMKEYQFTTDTYRLFATLSRTCGDPRRSLFHSSPSMKFMLRQIKAIDYTLPNDPFNLTQVRRTRASVFQERAALTTRDEQGNLIPAQDMDVALLLIYGYILYAGTSFTNALNYFFRAYALDPENPATLLSIGLGYIHHSLKRQSDNRHYLIMQGLAFMNEYRRVLSGSTVLQKRQEVEFNFARVWQMLGLAHLAVEGYKKCLEIGRQIRDEFKEKEMNGQDVWREEFTRDAAYALQCIYAFSGDRGSARDVTENWLVI